MKLSFRVNLTGIRALRSTQFGSPALGSGTNTHVTLDHTNMHKVQINKAGTGALTQPAP